MRRPRRRESKGRPQGTQLRCDFKSVVEATSGFSDELSKGDRLRSGRFQVSGILSADWMEALCHEGDPQLLGALPQAIMTRRPYPPCTCRLFPGAFH